MNAEKEFAENTKYTVTNKKKRRKTIYAISIIIFLLTTGYLYIKSSFRNFNIDNIQTRELVQQYETEHFVFYSKDEDKQCLSDLANSLESNYIRITNDLHTSVKEKVIVYIYSDLKTYHIASNKPNAPSWAVGNAVPGKNIIQMVNPNKSNVHSYSDFMQIVVHEFTHVVTINMGVDVYKVPKWLLEGVAVFEAKQTSKSIRTEAIGKYNGEFPTLSKLTTAFDKNSGYAFSYYIVDFIVKNYGYDKLVELIKTPSDLEKILGMEKDDFQKAWVNSMKNYN